MATIGYRLWLLLTMKETIDYLLIPCLIGGAITVTGFIIGMYKPKISGVKFK